MSIYIAFAVLAVLLLVGYQQRQGGTLANSTLIRSPKLGILNLKGGSVVGIVAADRSAVTSFFATIAETTKSAPSCDVLLVYCDFDSDGNVIGSTLGLREIVRDSGAKIVIVASENSGGKCVKAARTTGFGKANLVLTINRKGTAFATFFKRLFGDMANGVSMPNAWVKLAPQIPGRDHPDCPDSFFACEIGPVTLERLPI